MSAPDFEKMAREIETRILDMEISEVFRVRFGIEAVLRSAYEAGARDEREAVITKLCHEHVHEDDLIAWLRARGEVSK